MDLVLVLLCGLLGLVVSWLTIRLILESRLARHRSSHQPTFHHTHKTPVPRFGGLAFAVVFILIALVAFGWIPVDEARMKTRWVVVCSSLAMFLLGFWDDLRPLGARKKLLGQILIAAGACYFGVRIEVLRIPFSGEAQVGAWGYVVTIFWLVALTNLINLADGIDGLAGGVSAMLMCLLVYVGWSFEPAFPTLCAAAMCGALLAFLKYNFPPAKIYMGDGGAYFLGYLIAILALVHSQKGTVMAALLAPAFALALPIADTGLAILRRGLAGLPLFRPDRKHLHHRLLERGYSRRRAVLVLYAISVVCLLAAFAVYWHKGQFVAILFGCVCLIFLLSGRIFDFSREWMQVVGVLEKSGKARRGTRYALALGNWLALEAAQAESVEELWSDFQFMAGKVGFARATLVLADGQRVWESPGTPVAEHPWRRTYEINGGGAATIRLEAGSDSMSAALFEQLSEIAAEYWHRAALHWHERSKLPLRFDGRLPVAEEPEPPAVAS